jgi:hypothetical protein
MMAPSIVLEASSLRALPPDASLLDALESLVAVRFPMSISSPEHPTTPTRTGASRRRSFETLIDGFSGTPSPSVCGAAGHGL